MEIVCDTNIWYKLGSGELSIDVFNDHDLIVTGLTIEELGSSKNLLDFKTAIEVRDAYRAIFKYARIEMDRPINFILSHSGNLFNRSDEKEIKAIIEGSEAFSKKTDEEVKGMIANRRDQLEFSISEWNQPYQEITNTFNELLNRVRDNIKKNKTNKKQHRNTNNHSDIKKIYESIVINTSNSIIDWSKFEFLLNVTDFFFKELELIKMIFKQNDTIDLFNLAYVANERKYCTCDKKGVYGITKLNPVTAPFFYKINHKS